MSGANIENDERYYRLFEKMVHGVIFHDGEGKIIECNRSAELLLGMTRDQMMGKTSVNPEWRTIHEDGSDMPYDQHPVVRALRTGQPVKDVTMGVFHPHANRWFWLLINSEPEFREGESRPFRIFTTFTDITRQKLIEQRIVESEYKYKALFHGSPDGYLIIKDGKFVECNKASEDLIGGTREQILHVSPDELSPEFQPNGRRSSEYAAELIKETFEKGRNSFEWVHRKFDGTRFYAQINLTAIAYEGGPGLFVTWKDITESRNLQRSLQDSQIRFNEVVDQSQTVVWEVNMKGLYTYVSDSAKRVFGYDPEELICKKYFYDLFPQEFIDEYRNPAMKRLRSGSKLVDFENPVVRKDGTMIWVSTNAGPVYNKAGNLIGYMGSDLNITKRKLAEEESRKFKTIADQANFGMALASLEGKMIYLNKALADMHGYRLDELKDANLGVLHTGEQLKTVGKLIKIIQEKGGFKAEEVWRVKKDGTEFPSLMNAKLILDDMGKPQFMAASIIDITQQKQAEKMVLDLNANLELKIQERTHALEMTNKALESSRVEAEKANQAKSEFLSRMSHELRTPMNSILGFAQLLEMGTPDPKQQKALGQILKSGRHLLELINEVLDISKIEAGRISLSIEPVELMPLINEMAESIHLLAASRNITVEIDNRLKDRTFVMSDKQRLKQILLNLINNAVKYNREGGKVWIITDQITHPDKSDGIRISVKDNGIGIAQKDLNKVFVPFERIGAEQTATEGTGLGLAVVKKLTEIMGGSLGLESELGEGSTFWVEFREGKNAMPTMGGSDSSGPESVSDYQRNGTVIYVEDNVSNIELVEQILHNARPGIKLVTLMFGRQVVEHVRALKPDLILLDLNLPDMHGSEVFDLIKADEIARDIPVVVLSADAMPDQLTAMLKAGVRNYLTKPIDLSLLLKEIDRYI
jgi:PAS domain S-box-containing protein